MMADLQLAAVAALAVSGALFAATPRGDSPTEFGDVAWGRKLEPALEASARTGRPVLLLFQEVPG